MQRVAVDAAAPAPDVLAQVVSLLRSGGVAGIPTDTLYGLAVNPFDAGAVGRLFTIKSRALEKAVPLVAADTAQVESALGGLTPLAARLAARFWPGPLTLVVAAPNGLPVEVTGQGRTVGIRVPALAVTRALCEAFGGPLTATSANVSGEPATADPDEVARCLGSRLDVLLDTGPTQGGPPSTIVDVTGAAPRLIRAGAIAWQDVLDAAAQ